MSVTDPDEFLRRLNRRAAEELQAMVPRMPPALLRSTTVLLQALIVGTEEEAASLVALMNVRPPDAAAVDAAARAILAQHPDAEEV